MSKDETIYSDKIAGERENYRWPVRFDLTDGSLGITQWKKFEHEDGTAEKSLDRVLLSRTQVRALVSFVKRHD